MEIFEHPDQLPNRSRLHIFWIENSVLCKTGKSNEVYKHIYNRKTNEIIEESKTVLLFEKSLLGNPREWKANKSNCEWYLNTYFERALSLELYGDPLIIEFDAVIIPEKTLTKINGVIKEYNLEPFEDFIIYFISYIHKLWMDLNIYRYEEHPELLIELKKFESETLALVGLLQQASVLPRNLKNIASKINFIYPSISFSFQSDKMKNFILDAIIEKAKGGEGDWRTGLIKNFFHFNYKILKPRDFKYFIVQAIHNFLKEETQLKPGKGKRTTDREVRCIQEILETLSIPIRDKRGGFDYIEKDKIKIIRHWINKDIKNLKELIDSLLME